MQFIANISKLGTSPQGDQYASLFPLDAANPLDAAREAAERYTKAFYGETGAVSFVRQQAEEPLFFACIGEYRNGVTRGYSLSIMIREYHGS